MSLAFYIFTKRGLKLGNIIRLFIIDEIEFFY